MKAWTVSELDNIAASLKALVGSRLQEVQTSDSDLVLGFYSNGGLLWLWADLNAIRPCLLPWTQLPLHLPTRKTPLHLFLRAHFVDRVLRSVDRSSEHGRVVLLRFGRPEDDLEIEVRIFPHGRNVIARAAGKSIAWQKPKELSEPVQEGEFSKMPARDLEQLRAEWLQARGGKGPAKSAKDVKGRLQEEIKRKKKAVEKVLAELQNKKDLPWKKIGDWLKENQSLEVPKEWEPFIDKRRKLSWNIEECYSKARDLEGKIYGTEKRLETLHAEIAKLEERAASPLTTGALHKPAPQPLKDMDAHGRTLRLGDEITVIAGKSAADNLKLLRRARAWDWWFHLRDYPSSHAILFRNKSTPVGDSLVHQVVDWYVRQYLGAKFKQHAGEKFHILIAECRHVRPIKGDKLGRVTYHFERVVTYQVPNS